MYNYRPAFLREMWFIDDVWTTKGCVSSCLRPTILPPSLPPSLRRLDYFVISERLVKDLCDCVARTGVYGSDHCPLVLSMAMD